jgi:ATP-dependent Lon protease
MNAIGLNNQEEVFYNLMNEIEKEFYLYFGLKSIQKGLDRTESILDHFKIDKKTRKLNFYLESDLPEEIKRMIVAAYQQVFSNWMPVK